MKLSEDKIIEYIQKQYEYLIHKYSNHILGIFVVGSANYGFAEEGENITTVGIYIPDFEDLCTKPAANWTENNIFMVDIRRMYNVFDTCRWGALELLYSDYMIITPAYQSIFNTFLESRENIARASQKNRMSICYERMLDSFLHENYFEVSRLLIATDLYTMGCNCDDIFHLKKDYTIKYLDDIKGGNAEIDLGKLKSEIDAFGEKVDTMKDLRSPEVDFLIKQGIIDIISTNLNKQVSIDTFFADLTKTEESALKEILNRLDTNGNGNISISKIVEETGISRPVFKNLFLKLEKHKIAQIINQGVKGTYLNFNMSVFN